MISEKFLCGLKSALVPFSRNTRETFNVKSLFLKDEKPLKKHSLDVANTMRKRIPHLMQQYLEEG